MANSVKRVLVLGKYRREERLTLAAAAGRAAFEPEFVETARDAAHWLADHDAHAVLLDDSDAARDMCLEARAQLSLKSGADDGCGDRGNSVAGPSLFPSGGTCSI